MSNYIRLGEASGASLGNPPAGKHFEFYDSDNLDANGKGTFTVRDDAGNDTTFIASGAAVVDSFNGRTGAVIPLSGDYSASQVTNAYDKTSDNADSIDDSATTNKFATAAELSQIATNQTNISTNISNITDLQNDKEDVANKGVPNGYASLDGSGTVPLSQLPNEVQGGIKVIGFWDANTNTPDLSLLTLDQGEAYQVSVAGSTNVNGETNWKAKDLVVWSDALAGNWFKLDNTDDVISVNGQTGLVVLRLNDLQDVDTLTTPPTTSSYLKFDGVNWVTYNRGYAFLDSADVSTWYAGQTTEGLINQTANTPLNFRTLSFTAPNDGDYLIHTSGLCSMNVTNDNMFIRMDITGSLVLNYDVSILEMKDSAGAGVVLNILSGGGIAGNANTATDIREPFVSDKVITLSSGDSIDINLTWTTQSANDEGAIYRAFIEIKELIQS